MYASCDMLFPGVHLLLAGLETMATWLKGGPCVLTSDGLKSGLWVRASDSLKGGLVLASDSRVGLKGGLCDLASDSPSPRASVTNVSPASYMCGLSCVNAR